MSEFKIESESIDVEQVMSQIRKRIRQKRGEDYTEEQIRELADVKLEQFLDPKTVRSGMVQYYQKRLKEKEAALRNTPQAPPSFEFDPDSIYRSSHGVAGKVVRLIRRILNPFLKLFFNPAPIVHALTVQQQINERQAKVISQMVRTQVEFIEIAALNYEVMNNLVVEMTRLSIEMKNHRMRVESVAGRLDFDERRARSLEKVVQYREGAGKPSKSNSDNASEGRRRRRRRPRRRPSGPTSKPAEGSSASAPEETVSTTSNSSENLPSNDPSLGAQSQSSLSDQPSDMAESTGETNRSTDPTKSSSSPLTSPSTSAPSTDNANSESGSNVASSDGTEPSDR